MDLVSNKAVIICAGISGWYSAGVRRLERTLNFEGWGGAIMTWDDYPTPDCPTHEEVPYYFKIAAFEESIKRGFTHILWVDASFFCVKNPMKMFDIINEQGYWFFSTGYNLAQSVNDHSLNILGKTRDEAELQIEWASGCVGVNLENPVGKSLYDGWKYYMDLGLSKGSRLHDNQSQDPRFLFHRNDQSCLNFAIWDLGLRNDLVDDMVAYKGTGHNPEKLIWFIGGI
jgi:hypothetical protein